jgi:hypothetical protein
MKDIIYWKKGVEDNSKFFIEECSKKMRLSSSLLEDFNASS